MTGTPSRTATAYDGGITRHSVMTRVTTPRGYVGRKLEAKLRMEQTTHNAGSGEQTREAERSTRDRQKSAESISRQRTAAKEEHMESNRNGAIDG